MKIDWIRIRRLLGLTWKQRRVPFCGNETWLRVLDWCYQKVGAWAGESSFRRFLAYLAAPFIAILWAPFIIPVIIVDLITWPWQMRARKQWEKMALVAQKLQRKPPPPTVPPQATPNWVLMGAALMGGIAAAMYGVGPRRSSLGGLYGGVGYGLYGYGKKWKTKATKKRKRSRPFRFSYRR
jgi:hypothetical protein